MTDNTQPDALRLANEFKLCNEYDSIPSMNDIAKAEAELRRQHAENTTLQQGYDAARLEIDSLQARVQELGAMLRENRSKRIAELEAQLDAIGAGGVEPLRKCQAKLHQIAEPSQEFPAMTPELASILGLMCFQCVAFAQALRAGGHQIKPRAEDEQAAVLHWMLSHYFRHGEEWRAVAAEDMKRMQAEALAAQAKQGGK